MVWAGHTSADVSFRRFAPICAMCGNWEVCAPHRARLMFVGQDDQQIGLCHGFPLFECQAAFAYLKARARRLLLTHAGAPKLRLFQNILGILSQAGCGLQSVLALSDPSEPGTKDATAFRNVYAGRTWIVLRQELMHVSHFGCWHAFAMQQRFKI